MTTTAVYEPIETRRGLPPDPEDMNNERAKAAAVAVFAASCTAAELASGMGAAAITGGGAGARNRLAMTFS